MFAAPKPTTSGSCLLCGSPLKIKHAEVQDPYSRQQFSILFCAACQLGQTSPAPADLGQYYPVGYHGGRHGITADYCARRRLRLLRSSCKEGSAKKLLDIGCGEGTFLLNAKKAGWSVYGTEINPKAARAAGLEVWERLEDAAQAAPFDCITLWHSLEHLPDPLTALRQARKLIGSQARLIIAVPDAGGLQAAVFGPQWLHLDVPRHLFHFSQASLEKLVAAAGFEAIRTWHQEFEYDFLGWLQSGLNKVLPDPNVLFELLTGRNSRAAAWQKLTSVVAGGILAAPALAAVALGTGLRRGGTLVLSAQPRT